MNFLFYDDEIANSQGRICSLGYEIVNEGGRVLDSFYTLIDPESDFQGINICIHGITPDDVVGAPTFDKVFKERLSKLIAECTFVAHNAKSADLVHIRKSLAAYGIEAPEFKFIDTMDMARALFPKGQRRLDFVCNHYGINTGNYHNALDDASSCRKAFFRMLEDVEKPEVQSRPAGYASAAHESKRPDNAIHGSNKTFFDVLDDLEYEELRGDVSELTSIKDLKIVVTGLISGYTREDVKQAIQNRGGKPTDSVSGKTSFLAIGPNASMGKVNKARENNVPVISTEELAKLLERIQPEV